MTIFALSGLFLSAFVSATLLPCQSELVLSGFVLTHKDLAWLIVTVATTGNTLGSVVNWMMGKCLCSFHDRKWFPIRKEKLEKAASWYKKYGKWSLLLSWVPVIGDPLTLAAGILREPFWSFVLIVGFAKFARYAALAKFVSLQMQ